jgi:hypothetical protein
VICSLIAPRMTSHMISSMPSDPACRISSSRLSVASFAGSVSMVSIHQRSNSGLMNPARAPASWWDMPPVPRIPTVTSSR